MNLTAQQSQFVKIMFNKYEKILNKEEIHYI